MKNYLKYLLFITFFVVCICLTLSFLKKEQNDTQSYISEVLISLKEEDIVKEYEIKVNTKNKSTIFREDNIEEVIYTYPREGKPRISFPNLEDIEEDNIIEGKNTIVNYTYNLSYSDSCKYIKYLINNGYSIEMFISTSQYLEIYLLKNNIYRRLVLFSDSLMVCDMIEGVELPKVWEYLKSYNYNDFIETKFNVDF